MSHEVKQNINGKWLAAGAVMIETMKSLSANGFYQFIDCMKKKKMKTEESFMNWQEVQRIIFECIQNE